MQRMYENRSINLRYVCDDDMELLFFDTISDMDDPQYDMYQRAYDDLPGEENEYRVLFFSVKRDGMWVLKQVTCRVCRSVDSDEEIASCFQERFAQCNMA